MLRRIMTLPTLAITFMVIDYYVFQGVLVVSRNWGQTWKNVARYGFWIPTILSIAALLWWAFADPYKMGHNMRAWIITGLVATYFSKIFAVLFLFVDDLQRGVRTLANFFNKAPGDLP